jgi:hypothetical protein
MVVASAAALILSQGRIAQRAKMVAEWGPDLLDAVCGLKGEVEQEPIQSGAGAERE